MAPAPRPDWRHWRSPPRGPRRAGRPPRRCRHSCASRRAGCGAVRAIPLPGRRCRARRSEVRAPPPGDAIAARAPSTQSAIVPSSGRMSALGKRRVRALSSSSKVSRQMPLGVAATSNGPSGLSAMTKRIVSPRPPSRHAEGSCRAARWRRHRSGSARHSPHHRRLRSRSSPRPDGFPPAAPAAPAHRPPATRRGRG